MGRNWEKPKSENIAFFHPRCGLVPEIAVFVAIVGSAPIPELADHVTLASCFCGSRPWFAERIT